MKQILHLVLATSVVVFISCAGKAQQSQTLGEDFDKKLGELAEKYNMKGLAASIIFQDGSVWNGAIGQHGTSGDLSTNMLFEMGSNTKTFTAAMILQLADEGELTLSDTLGRFFDKIEHVDMGVTIKQLLGHTSGIYSYTNHADFGASVNSDIEKVWEPEEILENFMEPMRFDPGSKWQYSNTNFLLLGLIIEHLDERDYEVSLRQRLLDPLELEHSYLDIFESYGEPRSGTWLTNGAYFNQPYPAFMSAAWAAGGLVCTTEDLAHWAEKLYTNQVISEAWTDSMKKPVVVNGKETDFGLALFYRNYGGYEILGHGGATLQHSLMDYVPELGVTLVTVTNEQGRSAALDRVQEELFDMLFEKPWGLSIEHKREDDLTIFPNPVRSMIQIGSDQGFNDVHIYDMAGELLISVTGQNQIDVSGLVPGTYLLEALSSQSGELLRERFMVVD
mgnify:CR=1 FL=1